MDRLKALVDRAIEVLRMGAYPRTPGSNPHAPPVPMLRPCTYSILGHAAVVTFMLIGFAGRTQPTEPAFGTIAIDGVVLDDEAVKREIQRLDNLERAAVIEREQEVERLRKQIEEQQEQQRRREQELSSLSSQTEEARRTLAEQQTQASRQLSEMQQRQQREQEQLERIERERKEEEERAKAAAAELQKAEAERKKAEEEARKLSEEAEEAERRLAETERKKREAELAEQMKKEMAEERRRKAIESGLLDQYKARIRQRIESNWQRPTGTREDLKWVVLLDVCCRAMRFRRQSVSSSNSTARKSTNVPSRRRFKKSSPLPAPPVPELFERQLRLRYPPFGARLMRLRTVCLGTRAGCPRSQRVFQATLCGICLGMLALLPLTTSAQLDVVITPFHPAGDSDCDRSLRMANSPRAARGPGPDRGTGSSAYRPVRAPGT